MDRSWFHANLTGVQAEKLLLSEGKHGSFLIRPSQSSSESYSLSVRVHESVTHVRINNDGDCYNLLGTGGDTFATLGELIKFYSEGSGAKTLYDTAGTQIELLFPLPAVDHYSERFFHRDLSGKQAQDRMLEQTSLQGTFLVRASQHQENNFALSIITGRADISVLHVVITLQNGKYGIGDGNTFSSLSELVNYYRSNKITDSSGIQLTLKQAVDLTQLKVPEIQYRVGQLDKEFTVNGMQRSGFWEEFEHLQMQENAYSMSRSAGEKLENKKKNRYKNILPFDETRVRLQDVDPKTPGADYINANLISVNDNTMPGQCRRYIATQGCLAHTIPDFWLMAMQQHSSIIVMITEIIEDGKNKCARYYPDTEGEAEEHTIYQGLITVTLKSKVQMPFYTKRTLDVVKRQGRGKEETVSRTFHHFQYTRWKDKKVPTATEMSNVIQLVSDVDSQWSAAKFEGPIIVHCSAGIGRTGTFIVIDIIISQILQQGDNCDIDIFKTILDLRQQRSGFVQTDLQYKFIYMAIKRFMEEKNEGPKSPGRSKTLPSLMTAPPGELYENIPANPIATVRERGPRPPPATKKPPATVRGPPPQPIAPKPTMVTAEGHQIYENLTATANSVTSSKSRTS